MTILGIDFTSAPSRRKPITCAGCVLTSSHLHVQECMTFPSWPSFEAFLAQDATWFAACDFPFGLPAQFVADLSWPRSWEGYVRHCAQMSKADFVAAVNSYSQKRSPGTRLLRRLADELAGAISPLMVYRIPVGKMFFAGAPRLLAAGIAVLPCHPVVSSRLACEGYPALVARALAGGRRSYKSDDRGKQSLAQRQAREDMVSALPTSTPLPEYGIVVTLASGLEQRIVEDPMGDVLDAVLCAVQAAWAYTQRESEQRYGIPSGFEHDGWIVDPLTLRAWQSNNQRK